MQLQRSRHALVAVAVAVAVTACVRAPRPAAPATTPASIGETFTLDSKLLGQRRVIDVYLPPGYAKSGERYPVLYMPDGGMAEDFPHVAGSVDVSIKNAVIRPVIVVGIANIERRHDLVAATIVPEEQQAAPHAGGAEQFRKFIRDELKPAIAARYRTTAESAIVGESLAGLFVVETLLLDPTLFDGYIAADPSVWWNHASLVAGAEARLAAFPRDAGAKRIFVTSGADSGIAETLEQLAAALRAHPEAHVAWTYEPMPDEHHDSIFPTTALHGIRSLFANPERGKP